MRHKIRFLTVVLKPMTFLLTRLKVDAVGNPEFFSEGNGKMHCAQTVTSMVYMNTKELLKTTVIYSMCLCI
jgi:hypothetical protein